MCQQFKLEKDWLTVIPLSNVSNEAENDF